MNDPVNRNKSESQNHFCYKDVVLCNSGKLRQLRHEAIQEYPEAFGTAPAVELGRTERYYQRQLINLSRNPYEGILGIWEGEELIGIAGYGRRSERRKGLGAILYSIYVLPAFRRQGFGTGLVQTATGQCTALWNPRWVVLNVEIHNRHARERYLALGFEVEGTERQAFRLGTQWHDVHRMRKWLR